MNALVDVEDFDLLECGGELYEYDCHGADDEYLYKCDAFASSDDDYDDDDGDILIELEDDRFRESEDWKRVIQLEAVVFPLYEQRQEEEKRGGEKGGNDEETEDDDAEIEEEDDAVIEEEYYDAQEEEEEVDEAESKWGEEEEASPSSEVGYMIIEQATLGTAKEGIMYEGIDPQIILREKDRMKSIIQQRIADYQERQKKLEKRTLQEQQYQRQKLVKQFVECVQEVASPCKPAEQKPMIMPSNLPFQVNGNRQAKREIWLKNVGINKILKGERRSRVGL